MQHLDLFKRTSETFFFTAFIKTTTKKGKNDFRFELRNFIE